MTSRWSIAGIGVPFLLSCSAGASLGGKASTPGDGARTMTTPAPAAEARATKGSARTTGKTNDGVPANELAAPGLDDRFEIERQVAALERAVDLYQTFIDRAGDDPRYAEAVRRSKNRIEDARVTICFLLEKPCDDAEKP
jgi:hypothetical protein